MRDLSSDEVPDWVSPNASATMHTLPNHEGTMACVVCIRDWKGKDPCAVAALLVHEAVHVWQAYCRDIGERDPGSEQEAYGIQYIAQELLAEFARRLCVKRRRAR